MNEVIDVGDDGLEMNVRLDAIIHSSLDTINKIYRSCAIVNDTILAMCLYLLRFFFEDTILIEHNLDQ